MYSKIIENVFKKLGVSIGDTIKIGNETGILMPRIKGDENIIVLKLSNGYNIGVGYDSKTKIEKIKSKTPSENLNTISYKKDPKKPNVLVLSTGGTIVAKLDYRTGAVNPGKTSDDLILSVPELNEIANIDMEVIVAIDSANMTPDIWEDLIKAIIKNKDKYNGIVVTHGTDTMHYTSSAVSFALRGINIPIVFVGSQRSSDRGSSDAAMNFIAAVKYASQGKPGVFVCMHETTSDTSCAIIAGTHARKMHTSKRDAFKSVNRDLVARVIDKEISYVHPLIQFPQEFSNKFERKVALVKIHPGFDPKIIESYIKLGYKGIVIEGTGLGHTNRNLIDAISSAAKKKILIAMSSQCINGIVNMKVYELGRDLMDAGVIESFDMTPECAYVKMMYVLARSKNLDEAKALFQQNLVGELEKRIVD